MAATSVVIGNVIDSGIFTTAGFLARNLESLFTLLSIWIVGMVLALAGAFCYNELGSSIPEAGGESNGAGITMREIVSL